MYLETVTGNLVDVENPSVESISIEDISWGLSRIPRFAGHTISAIPYNVAQHSVMVAREVSALLRGDELATNDDVQKSVEIIASSDYISINSVILKALFHDAAEVYIGDIPSPVKKIPSIHDAIEKIENSLMLAVYEVLDVDPPNIHERIIIKYADLVARKIEAHQFMVSRGKEWYGLPDVSLVKLQKFESPMTALDSYLLFKRTFKEFL